MSVVASSRGVAPADEARFGAAVHGQRVVRGFLGRMSALREANLVYEKIFDPRTKAYYYYNTRTYETTWQPPAVVTRILGEFGDLDAVAPTYTDEEAAVMLQAAWRRRQGVRTLRALLATVITKVFDESTGAHYYFNSLTGETSWNKPALFGSEDVDDYLPGTLLGGEAQESVDSFGTGNFGYEQSKNEWGGQEAWTEQQQQLTENQGGTEAGEGYEGWVWDDSVGWYFDEELSIKQLAGKPIAAENPGESVSNDVGVKNTSGNNESSSDSDSGGSSASSGSSGGGVGDKRRRKKKRRRSLAPRNYPRSKAQRLVDEAEDSVDGAQSLRLDLSMLNLDRVTSRVYGLDWLETLDLSSNRLTRISPDLAGMESLIEINLRHNRIRAVPDELEALTQLRHLRLGYNRIRGFRGNIFLISSLETLDLAHNRLKVMPLQVGDLQLLKRTREWEVGLRLLKELLTLDVSHNRLEIWPAQVDGCRKLRNLRLGHNKIQEVPESLGDNTALTNLDLCGNSIKTVPDTINSLSSLTTLDISRNELETLSVLPVGKKQRGARLVYLETLRIERNCLTEGPATVETLTTLTELDVSCNPIVGWAPDVSRLRKMKHLRLSAVGLSQCPEGLGQLGKLEDLDLSYNSIDTLDPSMASLFKLRRLNLRENAIKDLGPCVGGMISLTYLDASGNGLDISSSDLSRCTALEHLDLSGGNLETLPEGLTKLTRLRCLRAEGNRLSIISPGFSSLTELQEMRLGGNRLRSLPDSLQSLQKMRYAELSRNLMESPPPVTRQWPLLAHLVLSRNPLKGRQRQSRRLLQAAQRGHDAMHKGLWKEAVQHLNVAAEAYDDAIHVVPDFPDTEGRGPPLALARPHDTGTFHHRNLGIAHLQRAREVAAALVERRNDKLSQ